MTNKLLLTAITIFAFANLSFSQVYSGPESVEWDSLNSRYLISNTTTKTILSRSSSGVLSTFKVLAAAPYGLEILGTKLYVCNGTKITVLDLATGNQLNQVNCAGSGFLNGITHDNNGNVFATDFSTKKIYRINTLNNTSNVFVANTTDTPNGICFDVANNRLVYGTWNANAKIKAVSLADSSQTTLATTTFGSIDGITIDPFGNFYIAAWGTDVLVRFNNDCTQNTTVMTGLNNPADICYNTQSDSIAIPNSGNNTVVFFYNFLSSLDKVSNHDIVIYPNPTNDFLNIEFIKLGINRIEIIDIFGNVILNSNLESGNRINISNLAKGIYFIKLGDKNEFKKIIKK